MEAVVLLLVTKVGMSTVAGEAEMRMTMQRTMTMMKMMTLLGLERGETKKSA